MCVWMCTGMGEADFASLVFCFLWKRNGASTAPGSPKHKAYKRALQLFLGINSFLLYI